MSEYIELAGSKNGYFRRKIYVEKEKMEATLAKHIAEYNNTDIYYTVYTYTSQDYDRCPVIAPVYFDFDDDDLEKNFQYLKREVLMLVQHMQRIWHVPSEQFRLYFSGSKGFHVLIPYQVFGIQPSIDLNEQYKKLAKYVSAQCLLKHLDLKIYDRKRLFRLPGTKNGKSGLYKVPLTMQEFRRITYSQLVELAKEPREDFSGFHEPAEVEQAKKIYEYMFTQIEEEKPTKSRLKFTKIPQGERELLPCIVQILKDGADEGQRNNTLVVLASSLFQSGRSEDDVEELLQDWNDSLEKPLPKHEVQMTLISAYKMAQEGRGYGCAAIKDLDLCIGEACKLMRGTHKKKGEGKWQRKSSTQSTKKQANQKSEVPTRFQTSTFSQPPWRNTMSSTSGQGTKVQDTLPQTTRFSRERSKGWMRVSSSSQRNPTWGNRPSPST